MKKKYFFAGVLLIGLFSIAIADSLRKSIMQYGVTYEKGANEKIIEITTITMQCIDSTCTIKAQEVKRDTGRTKAQLLTDLNAQKALIQDQIDNLGKLE